MLQLNILWRGLLDISLGSSHLSAILARFVGLELQRLLHWSMQHVNCCQFLESLGSDPGPAFRVCFVFNHVFWHIFMRKPCSKKQIDDTGVSW